jgi:hypothetical protein
MLPFFFFLHVVSLFSFFKAAYWSLLVFALYSSWNFFLSNIIIVAFSFYECFYYVDFQNSVLLLLSLFFFLWFSDFIFLYFFAPA